MESRGVVKKKANRGKKGSGSSKAKKVMKYLEYLITGTPWIGEGEGGHEDVDMQIIEGVLADPENAHAREVQQHEEVGLLHSCLEQRKRCASAAGGMSQSQNKAGGSSDARRNEEMSESPNEGGQQDDGGVGNVERMDVSAPPGSSQPLLGNVQESNEVAAGVGQSLIAMHAG
eukprot:6734292-Prymnesium_polylepis.1